MGGFLPAVLLGGLGVLAGTVVDMTDPQTSLQTLLPSWFYPVFLLVIIIGTITNNVLTAYSTGLALQAVGIPLETRVHRHLRRCRRRRALPATPCSSPTSCPPWTAPWS